MSFKDACDENKNDNDECQWMPFKQYTDQENETVSYTWTKQDIAKIINITFTCHLKQNDINHTCDNTSCTNANKDTQLYNSNKGIVINDCQDLSENKTIERSLFHTKSSKEYWEVLAASALRKKSPKKIIFQWKQIYFKVLPLHNIMCMDEVDSRTLIEGKSSNPETIQTWSRSFSSDRWSLTSDESDNDPQEETLKKCDPIYSRFGELTDSFHTSEDGIVFNSQRELEIYKSKMADMKEVFHFELELIKYQHDQLLKAKKAEERKLLRMNSHDIPDEEPTEKDILNTDNNKQSPANKQERKSALFSSLTDAFSYARTGIQGIFVKNSPGASRKIRTENEYSDSSDDEEEKPGAKLLSQNPDTLLDNHDEFTRKMESEGGLKYRSSDKTDQQLSYQSLPPPLSLTTLPTKANT